MNRMISFGYGFVDGKLSVIAEEAEIVKGIFSDYTNGKILKEIADDLTTRKYDFSYHRKRQVHRRGRLSCNYSDCLV